MQENGRGASCECAKSIKVRPWGGAETARFRMPSFHRDKTVEHLETRARPGGRRTTRCSARLDRSDDATRLNNGRPPFKDPFGRSHVVDGVPSPSPCSCLLSPRAASAVSLLHTHLGPDGLHRHKSAPGAAVATWSQSLHHQLARGPMLI